MSDYPEHEKLMDKREEAVMSENETGPQAQTTVAPQVTFSAGSCVMCGAVVTPPMEATHIAWHALLLAEAGTWVLPSGIGRQ